jgi:hypothetical protein
MSGPAGGAARPAALTPSNHEIYAALREDGCPLCRVGARSEELQLSGFLRDGILNPGSRRRFVAAGGFCRRHAWALHAVASSEGTGASVASIYRQLARHDLASLERLTATTPGRAGRRSLRSGLARTHGCQICAALRASRDAHAAFLCQLLDDEAGRSAYLDSDGLCSSHLRDAVARSLDRDGTGDMARFLLRDWRSRLEALREGLDEYDRKRSYTNRDEPKGSEQGSWTEVVRRYVGDDRPRARPGSPRPAPAGKAGEA